MVSSRRLALVCSLRSVTADSIRADEYPWATAANQYAAEWITLDKAMIDVALKVLEKSDKNFDESSTETHASIASNLIYELRNLLLFSPMTVVDGELILERYLALYIEEEIPQLSGYLRAVHTKNGNITDDVIQFLLQWIGAVSASLIFSKSSSLISEKHAIEHWRTRLDQIARDANNSLDSERFARRAAESAKSAERASAAAREAAGSAGNSSLAVHFAQLAKGEARAALGWSAGTIAALLAMISTSTALSLFKVFDSVWSSIIGHLAVLLPMAAVAAYTARIAHHHRQSALWSSSTSVQLKSIAAYAEQFGSEESRESLLISLGTRVFSAPDTADAIPTDQVSLVPPALVELTKELIAGTKHEPSEKR